MTPKSRIAPRESGFPERVRGGQLAELNRLAALDGWEAALRQVVQDRETVDSIHNLRAADFQYLWDVPENSDILEIGAGLGTVSVALARYYRRVIAVEPDWERARFINIRAAQMGLAIDSVCADFLSLPLARGRFGAVMLNRGLPEAGPGAREAQIRFLASLRDLLQPAGTLCVSTANRWGLSALSGGGRRHRLSQKAGESLYSTRGYAQLFAAAGYTSIQAFHSWHGREEPTMLLPLDSPGALVHFVRSCRIGDYGFAGPIKDLALRAAARSGLWKQLAPDLVFLMVKN